MKTLTSLCMIAVLALVAGLGDARAQSRRVELGIDGGVEHQIASGEHFTLIGLPAGTSSALPSIRIGFATGPVAQFELALGATVAAYGGEETATELRTGASMLFFAAPPSAGVRPFVRLGALIYNMSGDCGSDGARFGMGGGLGLEAALNGPAAFRFEGSYSVFPEKDNRPAVHVLAGRFGISVLL
jgi:opacity protein-like surface antigen